MGGYAEWKWVQRKRSRLSKRKERFTNALPVDIKMDFMCPSNGIPEVRKQKSI
jgi:hypothetical protein